MTNQKSAELTEPGIGSLHDPAPFVSSHFASVVIALPPVVLAIRRDQLDGPLLQSLTQRVGVVASVGDYACRFLPRPTLRPRDADFFKRGFRKRNFCRRGTFQPNSQRKTLTVDQYHPLRPLAALGFTDRIAPFLAGAKLPSRNVSSHFSKPSASNAPNRARHAAPVCRIHRMPSKQARFDAHGRPRLSFLRRGSGNKGATNSHCSSVNSFCRFFITEAQQHNRLTRKYLS